MGPGGACAPPVTHLCSTSSGWLAPPLASTEYCVLKCLIRPKFSNNSFHVSSGCVLCVEVLVEQQGDELSPDGVQERLDYFLVERLFSSQANRLEDQRCPFAPLSPPLPHRTKVLSHSRSVDNLLLLIADSQVDRIEAQRAPLRADKVRLECDC